MKGKFKNIFNSEKLKGLSKKVFSKKGIRVSIAAVVVVFAVIGFSSVLHLGGRGHDRQFARGAQNGQLQPGNGQQGQRQMQGQNGQNQNSQGQKGPTQGRQSGGNGQGSVDGTAGASQNPGANGQKQ